MLNDLYLFKQNLMIRTLKANLYAVYFTIVGPALSNNPSLVKKLASYIAIIFIIFIRLTWYDVFVCLVNRLVFKP